MTKERTTVLQATAPAVLSNYNGMTAYICLQFIPTTAFLVYINEKNEFAS